MKNPLTVSDLKSLAEKLNLRPAEFIRKSGVKELSLKNHLDNEFHKVIDDDTWGKLLAEGHGHIYYKSYKRFDPKLYMH